MKPTSLIGHVIELLQLIEESQEPADRTSSTFLRARKYIGASDRRFITGAAFGIIRHRRYIEVLLEQYLAEHPMDGALDDRANRFLALYTLYVAALGCRENGAHPSEAYWNTCFPKIRMESFLEWVSAKKGLDFLREDELVRLGVKYSFQDWMVQDWHAQLGTGIESLLHALNSPSRITLRVNLLKCDRAGCRDRLKGEGIDSTPTSISPAGLVAGKRFNIHSSPAFRDGWFELQDEGSQIVSLAISPRPGNMVIDACAGAGGKALHLAELMRNKGEIVAIDVDSERLAELQRRADRAGVNCIRTEPRANLEPEPLLGKADIVLVDAPCSGVGTIRRNPRMKWSVTESMVDHFSEKQLSLLGFNSRFVKPGGRLVYSTCSLLLNENENVLHAFLNSHPEFTSDVGNLTGLKIDQGAIKLFPHLNETDGFFIAPMKRRKD